eukprot:765579-Hanusia_phi.AAC.2
MPVKGFELCFAWGKRTASSPLLQSLELALREAGVALWSSNSYMQNAESRGPQILRVASKSCFQLIVLSPDLLCSSSDCVHILQAIRSPRSRSIFFLDRSADWLAPVAGRTLEASHADRLEEALKRLGFRVVSCPKVLLRLVDSLFFHPEEGSEEDAVLSQWWSTSAPAYNSFSLPSSLSYGICSSRSGSSVSLLGMKAHTNFSLSGRLFLPPRSLCNGWVYLAKISTSPAPAPAPPPPPSRAGDIELSPAAFTSSSSSQIQRPQVYFELGNMLGISWLGVAVLLCEIGIGTFILLGPYSGDTFSSYSRIIGSQYGTCQLTGVSSSYRPPLLPPANSSAGEQVVGTCWATFQVREKGRGRAEKRRQICCENCRARLGCLGFTVQGARCMFADGSSLSVTT